jgi:predicted nucleotidyltransferase
MFDVELKDGRSLRVFTTNTYFFTEYTLDQIIAIDPAIDAIICSCPYGTYTSDAKALCIEHSIGLFRLREFMGAIRKDGEDFLNYLLREEQKYRIDILQSYVEKASIPCEFQIYVFGSYIRREIYKDIDLILVYPMEATKELINSTIKSLKKELPWNSSILDIIVFSATEYQAVSLDHDNRKRIL